jgi:hypothetical protein
MNINSQFEIEKFNRIIDQCEDIEVLREKLKEMVSCFYAQRETMAEMMKSYLK